MDRVLQIHVTYMYIYIIMFLATNETYEVFGYK
jgi:hypothetical protein